MPKKRTKCEHPVWNPQAIPKWPHILACGKPGVEVRGERMLCTGHLHTEQSKTSRRLAKANAGVGRYGKD